MKIKNKYKKIYTKIYLKMDINIIKCPHCEQYIEILELNCRIFRCGVYKQTGNQINSHLDEISCKELKKNDLIYGCGKPFKILQDNTIEICEYI
jgi:hypothetical protein